MKLVKFQEVHVSRSRRVYDQGEDGGVSMRLEGELKLEELGPFLVNPEYVTALQLETDFPEGDERRMQYTVICIVDQGDTTVRGSIGEVAERLGAKA